MPAVEVLAVVAANVGVYMGEYRGDVSASRTGSSADIAICKICIATDAGLCLIFSVLTLLGENYR